MKKFILLFGVLILCLTIISCDTGDKEPNQKETEPSVEKTDPSVEETDSSVEKTDPITNELVLERMNFYADKYGVEFEPNRSELPTYEQLNQIKEGMTYQEVYELVGNPQGLSAIELKPTPPQSLAGILELFSYKSLDGNTMYVQYAIEESDTDQTKILRVASCSWLPKNIQD